MAGVDYQSIMTAILRTGTVNVYLHNTNLDTLIPIINWSVDNQDNMDFYYFTTNGTLQSIHFDSQEPSGTWQTVAI